MNLAVLAGILLAVTLATARRVSLDGKTMQAAGEADEPEEAMREAARPANLVEKIKRAANEADMIAGCRGFWRICDSGRDLMLGDMDDIGPYTRDCCNHLKCTYRAASDRSFCL